MIYFDSAYIVKSYIHEQGSEEVRQLLFRHASVACCVLGRLEFATAMFRIVREGRLDRKAMETVFAILDIDDQKALWNWLPLNGTLIQRAVEAVRRLPSSVVIRSADVLHLVCAREYGCHEIYSNDRHLLAAATHFGLKAVNVIL